MTPHHFSRTILNITQGPYLSDHCVLVVTLGILKIPKHIKRMEYRRLKAVDPTSFGPTLYGMLQNIDVSQDLDMIILQMESVMGTLLDVHAPRRQGSFSVRKPQLWFNLEIKRMKRNVRQKERNWRRNPTEHTWNIYKEHRRCYVNHIRAEKCRSITAEEIHDTFTH